jgi:hypothetical protein
VNTQTPPSTEDVGQDLDHRLAKIEKALLLLTRHNVVKDFYTTAEAAEILDRRPFTVREWCRHERIVAIKRKCGRGRTCEWMISNAEMTRIKNYGILPLQTKDGSDGPGNDPAERGGVNHAST